MKKHILINTITMLAGILFTSKALAIPVTPKVYTSKVSTGNWSDAATWNVTGNSSPVTYIISANQTITVNTDVNGVDTIKIYGTLKFAHEKVINMTTNGIILVNVGGKITSGNDESAFNWPNTSYDLDGPFNGANEVTATTAVRYATRATSITAYGATQASFISLTPLPVNLQSISVDKTVSGYELNWVALDEAKGTVFEVEFSRNGRDYSLAGSRMVADENTSSSFSVNLGAQSSSFYVRLVEITPNGDRNILSVQYKKADATDAEAAVKIFPTQISLSSTLNVVLPESGDYQLQVIGSNGSMQQTKQIHTSVSDEVISIQASELNLTAGSYVAVITSNSGISFKTMIVAIP